MREAVAMVSTAVGAWGWMWRGNVHLTSVHWCKETPAYAGTNLAAKHSTTVRVSARVTSTPQVVGSVWVRLQMDLDLEA